MSIKETNINEAEWQKDLRKMWADEVKRTQSNKDTIKEAVKEAVKESTVQPDIKDELNSKLLKNILHATLGIVAGAIVVTAVRSLLNKSDTGFFRT